MRIFRCFGFSFAALPLSDKSDKSPATGTRYAVTSTEKSPMNDIALLKPRFSSFSVLFRFLLAFALWAAFLATAQAQTLPPTTAADQNGFQPYGSYHGGDIDAISLTNGTIKINYPMVSYPQRGQLHLSLNLQLDNELQHYAQECFDPQDCEMVWGYVPPTSGYTVTRSSVGPLIGQGVLGPFIWVQKVGMFGVPSQTSAKVGLITYTHNFENWSVMTADQSTHPLGNQGTTSWTTDPPDTIDSYQVSSGPFEALDATGWRATGAETAPRYTTPPSYGGATPTAIIGPDGVKYTSTPTTDTMTDPNGNVISNTSTTITDSMGRQIPMGTTTASTSVCPSGPLAVTSAVAWNPPGYNGGTMTYTYCMATVTPNMNPYLPPPGADGLGAINVVQSIVLPNGQTWKFEYYDPDSTQTYNGQPVTYGTLSKVTLPTGGSISYTYKTIQIGVLHGCRSGRWITSRTVNDESGSHTWTYNYQISGAPPFTVVTDPLGNDTVHTFGLGSMLSSIAVETQTQYFQESYTSGTLLKTVTTTYANSPSYLNDPNSRNTGRGGTGGGDLTNVVPTQIVTTWPNGSSSTVTRSYDLGFPYVDFWGSSTDDAGNPNIGIYGKVVSENVYDYGSGGSGPLLRTTNTSYAWQGGPNSSTYLSNNLLNLVSSVQVKDGGGTQRAYTTYGYDESGLQSSGITEQKVTGQSYPGHQTSVHRWLNSGTLTCPGGGSGGSGGYVISNTTYYDTGKVDSASDPCGHSTDYDYSGTYYGAYPTTVTNALGQASTNVYDFNTGVPTSTTDPNQLTNTYSYDSMWRLLQANHPDGGQDTITRQETSPPFTATLTSTIDSGHSKIPLSVFDGLGRVSQTQLTSDPQGIDYVDTTYDALGRVATVSNPYRLGL